MIKWRNYAYNFMTLAWQWRNLCQNVYTNTLTMQAGALKKNTCAPMNFYKTLAI